VRLESDHIRYSTYVKSNMIVAYCTAYFLLNKLVINHGIALGVLFAIVPAKQVHNDTCLRLHFIFSYNIDSRGSYTTYLCTV
jgi:hypothetical protein